MAEEGPVKRGEKSRGVGWGGGVDKILKYEKMDVSK